MEPKTELQKNAIQDIRRKELETFQRALDVQWLDSRMEDGRMGRCLALIRREADMEKEFQERTDHAAIVNARAEKETSFGIEIAKVRNEETCQLLRRHYLRERDPGLRELAKKLQAGYVCRDLRQQILHNEYKKLQEKAEEKHANSILNNALFNDHEQLEREQLDKLRSTTAYRQELQQQLVNRQRQKQCQYEDLLIEKKMLDDVLRTISDEDKRELDQKRELTERMRREMVTFQRARDSWRAKQKELVTREEMEIEKQKQAQSNRSAAVIAEREQKLREREEVNAKIAAKILADEAERQQREDIIKLLQEQEYLEKNAQDDVAERAKGERVKSDTKGALTEQMRSRERLAREQRLRDEQYRREAETKILADEEKERDKQRKLREKNRQYSNELLRQIEQNARRRERDRDMEAARATYVWDCDRKWQSEVQTEREKIIEDHAPHLLGYMQAGVLKPEDLPALYQGASKHKELAGLDIESLARNTRAKRFPKCNAQCQVIKRY